MRKLDLTMSSQPDDTTCGPTCLHSLYRYLGMDISLERVIAEIDQFDKGGGTLGVILAKHALQKDLDVVIYSYNLNVFDPTWFELSNEELIFKLELSLNSRKKDLKYKIACNSYIEFLKLGGKIKFADLNPTLILKLLKSEGPILTGLSSTWLYQNMREEPITTDYDDIEGEPAGHFVVVYGYDKETKQVNVADPHLHNPIANHHYYYIPIDRLINSILLGVMTYDGNLVVIKRKKEL